MKNFLKLICILTAIFCIYFPFSYFKSEADKKEVIAAHILVDTQEDAKSIKNEIESGLKFEDAATKYLKDEYTKDRRGLIGVITKGQALYPEFGKVIFKIQKGEVSEPVKTSEGWHLIKVYDTVFFSDKKNFDERYHVRSVNKGNKKLN